MITATTTDATSNVQCDRRQGDQTEQNLCSSTQDQEEWRPAHLFDLTDIVCKLGKIRTRLLLMILLMTFAQQTGSHIPTECVIHLTDRPPLTDRFSNQCQDHSQPGQQKKKNLKSKAPHISVQQPLCDPDLHQTDVNLQTIGQDR